MTVRVMQGDCIEVMQTLAGNSIDAVVTDPPYELGFMGHRWDGTGVAFDARTWREALRVLKPGGYLLACGGTRTYHRMVCAVEDAGFEIRDQLVWVYSNGLPKARKRGGRSTTLKPALEPIVLARKPLVGAVATNVLAHGTGELNIDGCLVPAEGKAGRWPSNLIHDGSDDVLALFPMAPGQLARARTDGGEQGNNVFGALRHITYAPEPRRDSGSAARFFYCARASKRDRGAGNSHPTVKPTELMRYLCRLVTPPGGTVLDPFMGSGSTLKAAELEGLSAIGIELDPEFMEIARRRLAPDAVWGRHD